MLKNLFTISHISFILWLYFFTGFLKIHIGSEPSFPFSQVWRGHQNIIYLKKLQFTTLVRESIKIVNNAKPPDPQLPLPNLGTLFLLFWYEDHKTGLELLHIGETPPPLPCSAKFPTKSHFLGWIPLENSL